MTGSRYTVRSHDHGIGNEIVAIGDLYKTAKLVPKEWFLRKFFLCGHYLTYTDEKGFLKGHINIMDCTVRRLVPEDCKNEAAKYAFALYTNRSNRRCLLNAPDEKTRTQWITVLESQIDKFNDRVNRFLYVKETVLATSTVRRTNEVLPNISSEYKLLLTNYPRFLLVLEPTSLALQSELKDELIFSVDDPPSFIPVRNLFTYIYYYYFIC